ncbi:MAG: hypothetical protein WHW07_07870 [Bacteroidales bacterium]|nr:hypothetical protein [Bacteroidales bacterium]HOL97041.1 hypothetical protein [Bacteroidales bacterium]HOM35950.1 hypothetical protein [Bacteroidales bacterium]HPD23436.1 hypothetical protein [Bacteroidales bacterium]HRS99396.1 hypothetical protein [Bacteroidales bacterium]
MARNIVEIVIYRTNLGMLKFLMVNGKIKAIMFKKKYNDLTTEYFWEGVYVKVNKSQI